MEEAGESENRAAYEQAKDVSINMQRVMDIDLQENLLTKRTTEAVIENMGVDISIISPNMEIISLNRRLRERFPQIDTSKKPLCYKALNDPPREEPCSGCLTCLTLRDGEVHESIKEVQAGDQIVNYRIVSSPVKDAAGTVISVVEMVEDITEKKRSEEKYRTILRTAIDGFWITDMEGRILEVNDSYCNLTGYSREEMLKMSIPDVEAIEDPEETARHIAKVMETGTQRFETCHRCRDGRILEIEVSVNYMEGDSGQLYVFLHDITERKLAEKNMRLTMADLQLILDTVPATIWYKDLKNNIIRVNKAAADAMGMHREDIEGKSSHELFPDDADHYYEDDMEVINSGIPKVGIIEQMQTSSGEKRWVQTDKFPTLDEKGNITGLIAFVLDITERKHAEEEIRRLSSFPEMNPNPVIEIHRIGRIIYTNTAARDALAVLGQTDPHSFLPRDIDDSFRTWGDNEKNLIYREVTIADRIFGESIYFSPEYDSARIYAVDITEQKKATEKIQQALANLGRSNAELEQFAYISSHDLQEPLRGISNFAQLLQRRYKGKLDNDADEYLNFISESASRMMLQINELLELSRVSTKGKPFEAIDCHTIFEYAISSLKEAINESGAIVTHDPLPVVVVDRGQMERVFQNLISNAIKFHSEAAPVIHIGVRRKEEHWIFSVHDNGIGIDPKHFERIFIIFKRLHAREEYPGTGIGLSICKKIIERHGGRIWVGSEPGKGSTFYFSIPVKEGKSL